MRLQRVVVVVVVDVGFGFFLPSLFPLLLRRLAVFFSLFFWSGRPSWMFQMEHIDFIFFFLRVQDLFLFFFSSDHRRMCVCVCVRGEKNSPPAGHGEKGERRREKSNVPFLLLPSFYTF